MRISLEAFHSIKTYGGVLEGLPTVEQTLDTAKHYAERYWGKNRPTLVREPSVTNGRVPRWTNYAWLDGPAMKDGCGSHLFVIWFTDQPAAPMADGLVSEGEWRERAEDWDP